LKPGNAGGGKDPDFWYAFEEGKVKVIGDEPATPTIIRVLQRKLYREAKDELTPQMTLAVSDLFRVPDDEASRGCGKSARGSMSGDGKRSVAAWPKLPRPSSTLP
jgi:hypothetical protein